MNPEDNKNVLPYNAKKLPMSFSHHVEIEIRHRKEIDAQITFPTREYIPNALKWNSQRRQMIIMKFWHNNDIDLIERVNFTKHQLFAFHIIRGRIQFKGEGPYNVIEDNTTLTDNVRTNELWQINKIFEQALSYQFTKKLNRATIKSVTNNQKGTIICMEIFDKTPLKEETPMEIEDQERIHTITEADLKYRRSVITKKLTSEEIDEKTVVLDVEMAIDKMNQLRPLQVSIINLKGEKLMNTYVAPKGFIVDYHT
jgi:hypothetical protein